MPVVPAQSELTVAEFELAVPLARYAQIIEYDECAFWGVNNPDDTPRNIRPIWSKRQRDVTRHYLAEAQIEIENVTNFPLRARWFVDEHQRFEQPMSTEWGHVIEGGVRSTSTISAGEAVNHATDPATVGPVATTVTDEEEIYVYHPGTDFVIHPSNITISGGNVTIEIPRCRMVKPDEVDNDAGGHDYTDTGVTGPFEQTVDVGRVFNDPSTNVELVWPHRCTGSCASSGCSEYTNTACLYVHDPDIGVITTQIASYSSGAWARSTTLCCGTPSIARLSYRAGLTIIDQQIEDTVVRLAHSKMPDEPCGDKVVQQLWKRDRNTPDVLTRERINCPFGLNDGAWIAWRFAQARRILRGGVLIT